MSITNNFPTGGGNKIETGTITTFSDVEDREGMLLCDGSSILTSDYPDLEDKLDLVGECFALDNGIIYYFPKPLNNLYFAIRKNSDSTYDLIYSSDFKSWTICYANCEMNFNSNHTNMGAYIWGYYIFFKKSGTYLYSTDLVEWQSSSITLGSYSSPVHCVAFSDTVLMVAGYNGYYMSATAITTWTTAKTLTSANGSIDFMTYAKGYFVLGGWTNSVYYTWKTPDGTSPTVLYQSNRNTYPETSFIEYEYNGKFYARRSSASAGVYYIVEVDIETGTQTLLFDIPSSMSSQLFFCEAGIFGVSVDTINSSYKYTLYLTTDNFNTYKSFTCETSSAALSLYNSVYINDTLYILKSDVCYYYFDGIIKKIKLPILNDTTNQLYGYIKT